MAKAAVRQLVLGPVGTNCYFLCNTETKECVIIDPADQAGRITDYLNKLQMTPKLILLTHGHFDHIHGVNPLREKTGLPVWAPMAEKELLADPELNQSVAFTGISDSVTADHLLAEGDTVSAAGFQIRVLETPGHTAGSCCYYLEDEKLLFSGDTLFCMSYGRTDLPTGSTAAIFRSVSRLLTFPGDVIVYPGHGESTSIGFERRNNPIAGGRY